MPDPFEPIVHDDDEKSLEHPAPIAGTVVPEQRKGPVPEQSPEAGGLR